MSTSARRWRTASVVLSALLLSSVGAVLAFQVRPKTSRFDPLVVENPTSSLDVATTAPAALPTTASARAAWDGFRAAHGQAWSAYLDKRSGVPLLVEGKGIAIPIETGATAETIATSLRGFIATNKSLLVADNSELIFDPDASGPLNPNVWQIVYNRSVAGVPVVGERYMFTIGHGNLMSFGAPRWSRIDASPFPDIDRAEAFVQLTAYMGLNAADGLSMQDKGTLELIALRATEAQPGLGGPYDGPVGSGYSSALVWRVVVRIDGEPGTWEALIDAHSGAVRSFNDINDYAQAKGGVYPVSDDGIAPDGIEQPNYPMPYTNITIGAASQTANSLGNFNCTPGGSIATTTLAGQYVKVIDTCGAISQSITCDNDLDLSQSAGTDCAVPAGSAGGNTHASRTGFYHLNRISEHARVWLPTRTWLTAQLTDNVNLPQTCNAYWSPGLGTVNFYKSGGGCRNTGEIAGVFLHEWGHGMDTNDGGASLDNPSEAYADVTAMMSTHVSCVGRGFYMSGNCSGYGDACTDCSGIRDQDWAKHASGAPATPSGFLTSNCTGGSGPCGREVHCESHVSAETLWDLATRDLPAAGLDLASSWQLADKLWYKSRLGSGGNAYNCSLPNSDGCSATSWFSKIRAIDDDDGNLANGTPHAAAIYAAFNRHKIACGLAGDASNQNSTTCPAIGAPALTATAGSGAAVLNWTAVASAASYNILRNDASCAAGSTIVANVPGTTYMDNGLANGFPEYYTIQAVGVSSVCDGRLSNCQPVTPQPLAGTVKLGAAVYSCAGTLNVSVTDGNVGGATTSVKLTSGTEPGGETITLTQVSPGSAMYAGTIATTSNPPAIDGQLSAVNGDTITATYIDANDGQGGFNLTRTTTAGADCIFPIITNVAVSLVTGSSARVTWNTNEAATSVVHYGLAPPPGSTSSLAPLVLAHVSDLTGLTECSSYVYSVESADSVGNSAVANNAGTYFTFLTGMNTTPSYASTDTPVVIPDNNPTGATSTITVPDNKIVQKVTVKINISHTYDADIAISLIPPVGAAIPLATNLGSFGNDYINTVFDDAAATAITSGAAPFTGSFRPQSPLSAVNGITSAGAWKLRVVDSAGLDVGTINSWTLSLTYPAAACGPHAAYTAHASVGDACGTGGAGNGNGTWDAGEQVNFKVNLGNDGTTTLTGVTATVTSATPGVVMLDGTATWPSIPAGTTADSAAPHFTALLPVGLSCGGTISFAITINSNQGSWSGSFTHDVGLVLPNGGIALNEQFAGGIPATWTIVDGGVGGGAAATWTTANPGAREIVAPMVAPVATVDSDNAGNTGAVQDEHLITPTMDLSATPLVTLTFDQFFRWFTFGLAEVGDVDVRSSVTAPNWVNVLHQAGASSPNPDHKVINISAQAAGATGVQVRFHYFNAEYEYFWQVDNVRVDYLICNQSACAAAPGAAKPVADGSYGTAMKAGKGDSLASTINLTWDVSTCSSTDHHVLYGNLASVASLSVSGSACNLGASGSAAWSGVPAGSIWWVVVGDNDGATEGSWGTTTSGERGGASASGQCGMALKNSAGTCP